MTFIDAVIAISKSKDLELCDDPEELNGKYSICVYKNGLFIGKLRWPHEEDEAKVDKEVEELL